MFASGSRMNVIVICKVVCDHYGVTLDDLFSTRRWQPLARARQDAMCLIRRLVGLSYPQIGRIFDRDHTTVLYACRVAGSLDGLRDEVLSTLGGVR